MGTLTRNPSDYCFKKTLDDLNIPYSAPKPPPGKVLPETESIAHAAFGPKPKQTKNPKGY